MIINFSQFTGQKHTNLSDIFNSSLPHAHINEETKYTKSGLTAWNNKTAVTCGEKRRGKIRMSETFFHERCPAYHLFLYTIKKLLCARAKFLH